MVAPGSRPASVADVHELAMAMPHVTRWAGPPGKPPIYQVGGKSFVFFRNPRPDAVDPVTGERYDDVIVFWVADEADKRALIDDEDSPFFTTPHFDGHLSVLIRGKDLATSATVSWPRWCRTPGSPVPRPGVPRNGWKHGGWRGEATGPFGMRLIFD